MSAFDVKQLSEQDAFRLENARREEANSAQNDDPGSLSPAAFDGQGSPVAKVVEQIMSHWAEADDDWVQELAEQSGDPNLKKIVGETQGADARDISQGMAGDFQADAAGLAEGIEVPPRADGGEFGGGGGGGGGDGANDLGIPGLMGDEGGMADPGDMPDGAELPGFSMESEGEAAYGGDDDGGGDAEDEDDEPVPPPKPDDPKKPKKP